MGELIHLTGPVRSGKSARAVEIAKEWGDDVVFVATWRADPGDDEMAERVRKHRAERPGAWRTLEAPHFPVVIVGDEIGWSPVPMDAELRRFRDLVGLLAQATSRRSTEAWLIVSGCPMRLK